MDDVFWKSPSNHYEESGYWGIRQVGTASLLPARLVRRRRWGYWLKLRREIKLIPHGWAMENWWIDDDPYTIEELVTIAGREGKLHV